MYTTTLKSTGNPDYGQYLPISNPRALTAETLDELVQAARRYIQSWNLGAGNWPLPAVFRDGTRIGRLAYNGKLLED